VVADVTMSEVPPDYLRGLALDRSMTVTVYPLGRTAFDLQLERSRSASSTSARRR
jgi:hypothetical protein